MPKELTEILIDQHNAEFARLSEMHKAIKQLLSELTTEERQAWQGMERRAQEHHQLSKKSFDEIAAMRTTNSTIYLDRMHALLERDAEWAKSLRDELKELVKRHPRP